MRGVKSGPGNCQFLSSLEKTRHNFKIFTGLYALATVKNMTERRKWSGSKDSVEGKWREVTREKRRLRTGQGRWTDEDRGEEWRKERREGEGLGFWNHPYQHISFYGPISAFR
jgi:hypothetical protein